MDDAELQARFDEMKGGIDRLTELMISIKESLEQEIRDIGLRMDNQARRMRHHEALWKAGRTWSSDVDDWRTDMDRALESRDQQIADLSARLRRLENPSR